MSRKTIAICVTSYDGEYETKVVEGVYRMCQENDINLLCFSALMRKPALNMDRHLDPSIIKGEAEIYNLINYDMLDGIILEGESFMEPEITHRIYERARQKNIPVVNVNDPEHQVDYNVELSDKNAMEFVMRHLVEEHGLTKINFIGGFPGNLQTVERLEAYKKILQEHDIPVEDDRIDYGEFWVKAKECTKRFMESGKEVEAIVCANDTMAFYAMDYLKEHGYSIPEDLVVTGFDGIPDCDSYDPTLTTVKRAFGTAGRRAVEILMKVWEGEKVSEVTYVDSELIKNQSCGCVPKDKKHNALFGDKYTAKNDYFYFNSYLQKMNIIFAEATTSEQLFESTLEGAEFFEFNRLFVCICEGIEKVDKSIRETETGKSKYGLTPRMVSVVKYGHDVFNGTSFDTSKLLPIDIFHESKPCFFAFSPIYFKSRFLGYVAYEPTVLISGKGDLVGTWLIQLQNNAGSFYMKNELQYVVEQLDNLYARDPLTGLYNRRGMVKNHYILDNAVRDGDYITYLVSDVDGLKKVNDAFGHEGGDTVIIRVASALSGAFPKDAVCVRTGGDEFSVFFTHEKPVDVDAMIKRVDQSLEDFNQNSGLPYKAGCSCGYKTAILKDIKELDDMIKEADDKMYAVKSAKKVIRKD